MGSGKEEKKLKKKKILYTRFLKSFSQEVSFSNLTSLIGSELNRVVTTQTKSIVKWKTSLRSALWYYLSI